MLTTVNEGRDPNFGRGGGGQRRLPWELTFKPCAEGS